MPTGYEKKPSSHETTSSEHTKIVDENLSIKIETKLLDKRMIERKETESKGKKGKENALEPSSSKSLTPTVIIVYYNCGKLWETQW